MNYNELKPGNLYKVAHGLVQEEIEMGLNEMFLVLGEPVSIPHSRVTLKSILILDKFGIVSWLDDIEQLVFEVLS